MGRRSSIKQINICRICRQDTVKPFLDLGNLPLPNGFLTSDQLKENEQNFPLSIGFCTECLLVQLNQEVNPHVMFRNYVYIPSASKTRIDNFNEIIKEAIATLHPTRDTLAVDIGSNDGSLLVEFKKHGVRTLGVDPAENLSKVAQLKGIETLNDYFNVKTVKKIRRKYGAASYITATNVVAHIGDLHNFFTAIHQLLNDSGIFICEFPYLVDLLEKKYFDTIYHEHLSYFSVFPLLRIIKEHNLKVINVRRTLIDGGALRLTIARQSAFHPEESAAIKALLSLEKKLALDQFNTYQQFALNIYALRTNILATLTELKRKGKVIAGYGASARGNILLGYCGIDKKIVDFIVDSTPYKQGLFTPGHHIPIYSEEALLQRQPDFTLVLAWNFAPEIIEKQAEYRNRGGKFIIPLPQVKMIAPKTSIRRRQKVVVVMPAYNAAKTLVSAYRRLPKELIDEVILVDDASSDHTTEVARKLPIKAYRNSINLGYGGNLKVCLAKAMEAGADIVIEYHPDDQYSPKDLGLFIEKAKQGYDFALGSRFIYPKEALSNKMPLVKFIANRVMSYIDELVLGLELSEFHSGFRMYTRKLLTSVPFHQNSDDYLFSFDIIAQAVYWRHNIAEVPISCRYHPAMHTANLRRSAIYAIGTFKTLIQYVSAKFFRFQRGPFLLIQPAPCPGCASRLTRFESVVKDAVSGEQFSIFFCTICQNGFTVPTPSDLSGYYSRTYYSPIKDIIYSILQFRRPAIIKKYKKSGKLLDVGCGDGTLARLLPKFDYTGVETKFAGKNNPNIQQGGVEKMKVKPDSFDVISFWESLEHIPDPRKALSKAKKAMKKNGVLIIESPNYSSAERALFGSRWFHLDPPRHITHFTPLGLRHLLESSGFKVIRQHQLYAPEYTPLGLAQSVLYLISPNLNLAANGDGSAVKFIITGLLLAVLLFITIPLSIILYWFSASPILLTVAKKKTKV